MSASAVPLGQLTLAHLARILHTGAPIAVPPDAVKSATRVHKLLVQCVQRGDQFPAIGAHSASARHLVARLAAPADEPSRPPLPPQLARLAAAIHLNTLAAGQSGVRGALLEEMAKRINTRSPGALGPVPASAAAAFDPAAPLQRGDTYQLAQLWWPLVTETELQLGECAALLSCHAISYAAGTELVLGADACLRAALLATALSADALGCGTAHWASTRTYAAPTERRVVKDLQALLRGSETWTSRRPPPLCIRDASGSLAELSRDLECASVELLRCINSCDSSCVVFVPESPSEAPDPKDKAPGAAASKALADASESIGAVKELDAKRPHLLLNGANVDSLASLFVALVDSLLALAIASFDRISVFCDMFDIKPLHNTSLRAHAGATLLRARKVAASISCHRAVPKRSRLAFVVQSTPIVSSVTKLLALECCCSAMVVRYRASPEANKAVKRPLDALPESLRVAMTAFDRAIDSTDKDRATLAPAIDLLMNPGKARAINPLFKGQQQQQQQQQSQRKPKSKQKPPTDDNRASKPKAQVSSRKENNTKHHQRHHKKGGKK